MNTVLSGTGWGEKPDNPIDDEIKVAPWLTPDGRELERKIFVAEEYWESKGRASERRKMRKERDRRANQWQGLAVMLVIFFFLALIGTYF